MHEGFFRRLWLRDRLALGVMALGSLFASILWRAMSRPMADTITYRAGAQVLRDGWPTLMDRTPGYPLVLLLTGSSDHSTRLLFLVQLAMHVLCTCLMVDIARQVGVGRHGRAFLAVLMQAPAVMLSVLYEGTEETSALLLTLLCWLLLAPVAAERRLRRSVAAGLCCAAAAMVRPTFAVLFVPAAVMVLWLWADRPTGHRPIRRAWSAAIVLALPSIVVVGAVCVYNGARFDSPSLTPLTPYHLSSRTSPYVENLPSSYEPARSVLIRERDQALLRGESQAPANFIWHARPALERATGLHGRDLDRYVMRMDIQLITHNPFAYLDTVKTASVNYTNLDSQPAILGMGRPAVWTQQALHQILLAAFVGLLVLIPGLLLAGLVPAGARRALGVSLVLCAYTGLVSILVETGTARLRAPSEPILALMFVVAASTVRSAWTSVRRASSVPAHGDAPRPTPELTTV